MRLKGKKAGRHEANLEIEGMLRRKQAEGSNWSESEKAMLRRYTGSGGLARSGAVGKGLLHEFYTPVWLAEFMWELARLYGYDGGTVLEPAAGTGNIITPTPDKQLVTAFEPGEVSASICEILNPGIQMHRGYFETAFMQGPPFRKKLPDGQTWLHSAPFSLVIGNPPFGIHRNLYSGYFKNPSFSSVESFFIHRSLLLLKPGGLLVFIIPSLFLRNGLKYNGDKQLIGELAELTDAHRLPPLIKGTTFNLDLLILRKK